MTDVWGLQQWPTSPITIGVGDGGTAGAIAPPQVSGRGAEVSFRPRF